MVTGKLGHAWVVVHGLVHGGGGVVMMWMMCRGWDKCMGILPGLVRLNLGIGGGLVGEGGEVFAVESNYFLESLIPNLSILMQVFPGTGLVLRQI